MNSGSGGADPAALTLNEFDGYLVMKDGPTQFHIPWHVLPRKDARLVPDTTEHRSRFLPAGDWPE